MNRTPQWTYRFEIPAGWAIVDFNPATRAQNTQRQVDASLQQAPQYEYARPELTDLIMTLGEEADAQMALAAGVLWAPSPAGPVTASLMLLFGRRSEPDDPSAEIEALLAHLAKPAELDFGPREVEVVELPAGPAVRMRVLTEAEAPAEAIAGPPSDRDDQPVVILDTVQIWVPVPGYPDMVVVLGSTPSLPYNDEIAAQVDAAARSLRFLPAAEA